MECERNAIANKKADEKLMQSLNEYHETEANSVERMVGVDGWFSRRHSNTIHE
jgi:hypothetical protein